MSMHAFVRPGAASKAPPVAALARPRDPGLAQEFHHWPLPAYVWPALERRYHSIFCSEPHLRLHGGLTPGIEAWVCRQEGRIRSLLLFERRGAVVHVLNEVFAPGAEELAEFATAVFDRHPALDAVWVRAAAVNGPVPGYTNLIAPRSEDFVLTLPADIDTWIASLSAHTREKLRYHLRRTQRKQPGFRFRIIAGPDVDDTQLHTIIDFNRARMQKKGRRYGMRASEERGLRALLRERGWLGVIEIDGQLRAGLLCTRAGDDLYMHVIAHDPACDDLRLGFLCCALTIQDAITSGLQRFHFLWGQYDYKTRLGGQHVALNQWLLLRSPLAVLWHPRLVLAQWSAKLRGLVRRLRQRAVRGSGPQRHSR